MSLGELSISINENTAIAVPKVILDMVVGNTITEWIIHVDIVNAMKSNKWCLDELENQIEALEKQEAYLDEMISRVSGNTNK